MKSVAAFPTTGGQFTVNGIAGTCSYTGTDATTNNLTGITGCSGTPANGAVGHARRSRRSTPCRSPRSAASTRSAASSPRPGSTAPARTRAHPAAQRDRRHHRLLRDGCRQGGGAVHRLRDLRAASDPDRAADRVSFAQGVYQWHALVPLSRSARLLGADLHVGPDPPDEPDRRRVLPAHRSANTNIPPTLAAGLYKFDSSTLRRTAAGSPRPAPPSRTTRRRSRATSSS